MCVCVFRNDPGTLAPRSLGEAFLATARKAFADWVHCDVSSQSSSCDAACDDAACDDGGVALAPAPRDDAAVRGLECSLADAAAHAACEMHACVRSQETGEWPGVSVASFQAFVRDAARARRQRLRAIETELERVDAALSAWRACPLANVSERQDICVLFYIPLVFRGFV